jgi:hypothetical protein
VLCSHLAASRSGLPLLAVGAELGARLSLAVAARQKRAYFAVSYEADHEANPDRPWTAGDHWCRLRSLRVLLRYQREPNGLSAL